MPVQSVTVTKFWKIVVAHIGDQGGCVGAWAQYFPNEEKAHAWFRELQQQEEDEHIIYEEHEVLALVLTLDDKKTSMFYIVSNGPFKLCQ